MGLIYEGARHWLEWGSGVDLWGRITGWIGAIALIYGGVSWGVGGGGGTGSGDGIDWWGCAMGACDTGWIRKMGVIHGGMRHWLDRGDGIDSWGRARHGAMRHWLDRCDGIDSWGMPWGRATLVGSK